MNCVKVLGTGVTENKEVNLYATMDVNRTRSKENS